ncbi:S-adenosyl-l-methionine hydroxide adenosyltransferase family protein [candidate division KSB1 bacterium]
MSEKSRSIITLLTDFSSSDGYPGIMKGVILDIDPDAKIIDVTHDIPKWDIRSAAFVLLYAYEYFPRGSIHVCVVDPGVGSDREIIILETPDHLFIAPDNGLLSLIFEKEENYKVYIIDPELDIFGNISNTFHGRDIFAPTAAYLSLGENIMDFGEIYSEFKTDLIPGPVINRELITGEIVYVDSFGNLISNIKRTDIEKFHKRKNIQIEISDQKISGLKKSYDSAGKGEILALISSSDFLEIACCRCSASEILSVKIGAKIRLS